MTEPLPNLETKLKGDVRDMVKALAEARAALKAYQDQTDKTTSKSKDNWKGAGKDYEDYQRLVSSKSKDGETALQGLQREYTNTSSKVKSLRAEFAKSGDANVFGDLKATERDLKSLSGYLDDMGSNFAQEGSQVGEKFAGNLISELEDSGIGEYLSGALIYGAVLASPIILATVAGALSAGIGAAGIAIGIVAAVKQPAVQGAFAELKTEAGSVFSEIGKEFAGPVAAGIGDLTKDLDSIEPGLKSTFASLAQYARPLIDGVGGFITGLLPGLEKGFANAEPFVEELATDLPKIGNAAGIFFDDVTKGGPAAENALSALLGTVDALLVGIGQTVEAGSKLLGWAEDAAGVGVLQQQFATGVQESGHAARTAGTVVAELTKNLEQVAPATDTAALQFSQMTLNMDNASYALDKLINDTNKWVTASEAADDANLAMHQALTAFTVELKANKGGWDENTAAGQKNVAALDTATSALTHYYDQLAQTKPLTEAQTRAELAAEQALLKQASAAGATSAETATLRGSIKRLKEELDGLHSKKVTVTINQHFLQSGNKSPSSFWHGLANSGVAGYANSGVPGGWPAYAQTGVYVGQAQPLYQFAEQSTGHEALIAEHGDKNRALATLAQAAGWFAQDLDGRQSSTYVSPYDHSSSSNSSGGGWGGTIVIPIVVNGKTIQTAMIKPAQDQKNRFGTTGLA